MSEYFISNSAQIEASLASVLLLVLLDTIQIAVELHFRYVNMFLILSLSHRGQRAGSHAAMSIWGLQGMFLAAWQFKPRFPGCAVVSVSGGRSIPILY